MLTCSATTSSFLTLSRSSLARCELIVTVENEMPVQDGLYKFRYRRDSSVLRGHSATTVRLDDQIVS
jgi:hypothetical protein